MANTRKSEKYPDYEPKFIAWMKHTNSRTGEVTWTDHVKVSGLLDRAHKLKFKRVTSCMLQAPSKENGGMCICHGEVETAEGHIFSAVADATPENVKPNVRDAFVRMADTRAIGRALRWALNIEGATAEEIVEDDAGNTVPHEQASKPAPTEVAYEAPATANGHASPAMAIVPEPVVTTTEDPLERWHTPAQKRAIQSLCARTGMNEPVDWRGVSFRKASDLIKSLNAILKAKPTPPDNGGNGGGQKSPAPETNSSEPEPAAVSTSLDGEPVTVTPVDTEYLAIMARLDDLELERRGMAAAIDRFGAVAEVYAEAC
jgi:hypothetical protein